jgi:SAM-dependent methyltransferase
MNPAPNFDQLAGIYRWMEWLSFGPALWRCRCHFLDELRVCRHALVLGDGDGRFTARLLESNPEIQIDAVDASAVMLGALAERAGRNRARVQTFCADVRTWEPVGQHYDLVVTHFFLDCLTTEEIAVLAARVRPHLGPGALWLISEFGEPRNLFGKLVARPVVSGLYGAFGLLTGLRLRHLPAYREALCKEGFKPRSCKSLLGGLLVTELRSAGSSTLLHSC